MFAKGSKSAGVRFATVVCLAVVLVLAEWLVGRVEVKLKLWK